MYVSGTLIQLCLDPKKLERVKNVLQETISSTKSYLKPLDLLPALRVHLHVCSTHLIWLSSGPEAKAFPHAICTEP